VQAGEALLIDAAEQAESLHLAADVFVVDDRGNEPSHGSAAGDVPSQADRAVPAKDERRDGHEKRRHAQAHDRPLARGVPPLHRGKLVYASSVDFFTRACRIHERTSSGDTLAHENSLSVYHGLG
jgi:hypothetical protein